MRDDDLTTPAMRELARLVVAHRDRLPVKLADVAAMLVASTVASAAAGFEIASAKAVRSASLAQAGRPESTVWFHDVARSLPAAVAARVNATTSSASASDSSDLGSLAHPGTPVIASALAQGEASGTSGEEVLNAIVLGYEASNRVAGVVSPAYKEKGFHGSLVEIFGAAVSAGMILKPEETILTHGLALSASSIGGLMAAANTSTNREYSVGLAALLGCEAAIAATAGLRGEEAILEKEGGFLEAYGDGSLEGLFDHFGSRWGLEHDMAVKLMPGGVPHHAMAEAAALAAIEGDVDPGEVNAIRVSKPFATELAGPRHPKDLVDAAHSAAYVAAASVADRGYTWVHASSRKIDDPRIRVLLDRVEAAAPDTSLEGEFRHSATVEIETTRGAVFRSTVRLPLGSVARGLRWDEVDEKFRALVGVGTGMGKSRTSEVIDMMHELADLDSISALTDLLIP